MKLPFYIGGANKNMIRHLPYIHTRYKLSINSP